MSAFPNPEAAAAAQAHDATVPEIPEGAAVAPNDMPEAAAVPPSEGSGPKKERRHRETKEQFVARLKAEFAARSG